MNIKTVIVGHLQTNCYILENDDDCIIVDPGAEPLKIEQEITKKLVGIIITHHHDDHIGALNYFQDKYDIPVYDYNNLKEGNNNIGNFEFDIIRNPGHTSDSVSIYFKEDKNLFSGDFIFYHTIGRTDLPTGNYNEMKKSIEKIKEYDIINIYPGHGRTTTLKEEIENNIYFS